jgi:hypothetical protein
MSEQSDVYICRNCDWTGGGPKIHTFYGEESSFRGSHGQEVYSSPYSGSMNKCPKCNGKVMTQKEWDSDDFRMELISRITYSLFISIIVIAFFIYLNQ